ncbi:hypothetical protein [Alteromonas sp. a30]|uniref:hypothetical protein n=1 Tax=Alteromonas sp. a30 TaxID=2730917 RepID=UPI002281896E|nr:hypothetical protein [Alteromonas sp. a30]MCY7296230.1 hypothetical protein [Alteromonas sp. a30]
MDIELLANLGLDLLEFDDRLPSMRFKLLYEVKYFGGEFRFNYSNLWVECGVWENWLEQLLELQFDAPKKAVFHDMDKDFFITITKESEGQFVFEVDFALDEFEMPTTRINSTFKVSQDKLSKIISSCQSFPVVW